MSFSEGITVPGIHESTPQKKKKKSSHLSEVAMEDYLQWTASDDKTQVSRESVRRQETWLGSLPRATIPGRLREWRIWVGDKA